MSCYLISRDVLYLFVRLGHALWRVPCTVCWCVVCWQTSRLVSFFNRSAPLTVPTTSTPASSMYVSLLLSFSLSLSVCIQWCSYRQLESPHMRSHLQSDDSCYLPSPSREGGRWSIVMTDESVCLSVCLWQSFVQQLHCVARTMHLLRFKNTISNEALTKQCCCAIWTVT